jgi:hypothetical protein
VPEAPAALAAAVAAVELTVADGVALPPQPASRTVPAPTAATEMSALLQLKSTRTPEN